MISAQRYADERTPSLLVIFKSGGSRCEEYLRVSSVSFACFCFARQYVAMFFGNLANGIKTILGLAISPFKKSVGTVCPLWKCSVISRIALRQFPEAAKIDEVAALMISTVIACYEQAGDLSVALNGQKIQPARHQNSLYFSLGHSLSIAISIFNHLMHTSTVQIATTLCHPRAGVATRSRMDLLCR